MYKTGTVNFFPYLSGMAFLLMASMNSKQKKKKINKSPGFWDRFWQSFRRRRTERMRGRSGGEFLSVVLGCLLPCKNACFCSSSPSLLPSPDHCCRSPIALSLPLCFSSALPLSLSPSPLLFLNHSATLHWLQQTAPLSYYLTHTHMHTHRSSWTARRASLQKYTVYMQKPHMYIHMFPCLCARTHTHG